MEAINNKTAIISIILPAYNAAHCIGKTIESVLCQSLKNFELIIINDGSKDETSSVVSTYSDNRLKLISQENAGANAARKVGVENSRAKYITFIDADDLIAPNALEAMLSAIGDNDVLITRSKFNKTINQSEYLIDTLDQLYPKELWAKLFIRSLFNDWVMSVPRQLTVGEDFIWNIRIAKYVKSVKVIEANYYHYQMDNISSIMNTFKKDISYEKAFYAVSFQSVLDLGFTNEQTHILLSTQRFYIFFGLVRDVKDLQGNDPFVRDMSICTHELRGKVNSVLYLIMSVTNLSLKIFLLKRYIKIRKLD